jgi:hypothetical protein
MSERANDVKVESMSMLEPKEGEERNTFDYGTTELRIGGKGVCECSGKSELIWGFKVGTIPDVLDCE